MILILVIYILYFSNSNSNKGQYNIKYETNQPDRLVIKQINDNNIIPNNNKKYEFAKELDFILQMHQRVGQQFDNQFLPNNLISIIDHAGIKLKTNKEEIDLLGKENLDINNCKALISELKGDKLVSDKKTNQKNQEISILRDTVKTLYADNQRLNTQAAKSSKQLVTSKQTINLMKKKLKKQDDQMIKHKSQLQKLAKVAQQRLGQYINQDKQKQKSIKKITQQMERYKSQNSKLIKQVQQLKKYNDQMIRIKSDYQANLKLTDAYKYQNQLVRKQTLNLQQKITTIEHKYTSQTNLLRQQISLLRQSLQSQSLKCHKFQISLKQMSVTTSQTNIHLKSLQQQLVIRSQKLKQKNTQLQVFNQQISKLSLKIDQLSEMSQNIMQENNQLREKCNYLEQRIQEYRMLQGYVTKIKGEVNHSRTMELAKLIDGLGQIAHHKYPNQ